jgi:uncharacterized membrane protein
MSMNQDTGTIDVNIRYLENSGFTGLPSLPVEHVTVALPPDMMVISVDVRADGPSEHALARDVTPVPTQDMDACNAVPVISDYVKADIYGIDAYHPGSNVAYGTSFGLTMTFEDRDHIKLSDDIRSQYVDIELYPVQYNPVRRTLTSYKDLHLEVRYTENPDYVRPMDTREPDYDNVIITPLSYVSTYQVLADHHNATGIVTTVVAVEDVYSGKYFSVQGADNAERIKYFIQDAIENWNAQYITLAGDYPSIPRRFAKIAWDFATDLYYSDIYLSNGSFADWNADGDAEWGEFTEDKANIDIRPDVYLGRLPSSNISQAVGMVEKVRYYDNNTAGSDWFKTVTHLAALSEGDDYGELLNDEVYTVEKGWSHNNLWGNKATQENFSKPENHSVGVMTFWGHGGEDVWLGASNIYVQDVYDMANFQKLPIITIMACECGHFDYGSDCFAESFLKNSNGGALAVLAGTRTSNAQDHDSWAGATNKYFHMAYKDHDIARVGQMYADGVNLFADNKHPLTNSLDYKNLAQYVFFGDPAATIGGYSVTTGDVYSDEVAKSALPGENVTYNISVENTGSSYAEVLIGYELQDGSEVPERWSHDGPDFVALQGGIKKDIVFNVTVPADAVANESIAIMLNASSVHIPTGQLQLVTTTTARTLFDFDFNTTDNATDIPPGFTAEYTFSLTNTGNDQFGFDIELMDLAPLWEYEISNGSVILPRGQSTEVTVSLTPGANVTAGSYLMKVRCTMKGVLDMYVDIWTNTTMLVDNGFTAILLDTHRSLPQGGSAEYNLSLENTGNLADGFELSFPEDGQPLGWNLSFDPDASIAVEAFEKTMVKIHVGAPSMALAGNYTIEVDLILVSTGWKANFTLNAMVLPVYEYELSTDMDLVEGEADDIVAFELTITNDGNIIDTYDLSVIGLPEGWEAEISDFVVIEAYNLATTVLEMTIDDGDVLGGTYNMTVQASSRGDNSTRELPIGVAVPEVLGLEVEADRKKADIKPGQETTFLLTLRNLGNVVDTYDIVTTHGADLTIAIEKVDVTIDGFSWNTSNIAVTASAEATTGPRTMTVTIASITDAKVKVTVDLTIGIDQVYGVELHSATVGGSLDITAGKQVEIGYTVFNTGNGPDAYRVTAQLPAGWTTDAFQTYDIEAGKNDGGDFVISTPSSAKGGKYTVTIRVVSKGDVTVTDEINFTVTLKAKPTDGEEFGMSTGLLMALIGLIVAIVVVIVVLMVLRSRKGGQATTPTEEEGQVAPPTEPSTPEPPGGAQEPIPPPDGATTEPPPQAPGPEQAQPEEPGPPGPEGQGP